MTIANLISTQSYFLSLAGRLQNSEEELSRNLPDHSSRLADVKKVFDVEKKLWREVQSTIMSVTESYSSTYKLNTVVSDLMALTKKLIEVETFSPLIRAATVVLVQLLAPIAPTTAEEYWARLNLPDNSGGRPHGGTAVS